MAGPLRVGGFLGAGKSWVVARLADGVEVDGLRDPADPALGPAWRVLVVVDAVNLVAGLDDPVAGALIRAQVAGADVVALNRTDAVDPGPARAALEVLGARAVVDASDTAEIQRALSDADPAPPPETAIDLTAQYTDWSYAGAAVLTPEAAQGFLRDRPRGVARISGTAIGPEGGLSLQAFGRAVITDHCEMPEETVLRARGPRGLVSARDMDRAFADAVANAAYRRGVIACR